MKKMMTYVILAVIFVALFITVETCSYIVDPTEWELCSRAYTEGYKIGGVIRLSSKAPGDDLHKAFERVLRNEPDTDGDNTVWVSHLDDLNDKISIWRLTKGIENLGKPGKEYLVALVLE